MAGSAGYTNGNWTVTGGGADIWDTSDQFSYASTSLGGDGTMIAEVTSLQNSDPNSGWSKAGLMFRNDITAGSVNVSIVATAGQGVSFQWRGTTGAKTSYNNIPGITAPVWLKLVRSAGIFTGFYSTNGSTWVQVTNQSVTMNSAVLAGLDVTAHNNSALNTATFTNVSIALAVLSAPVVTNLPPANVQPTSTTLLGQILSTGNQTPSVTLFYGPSDAGTKAAAWSNNVALGPQTAVFDYTVAGLMTNTTYYYTAWATNSIGAAWAYPSQSFTTPSNAPPVQPILTYRYDNSRQGANTNEVQLTPLNVNVNDFGKLFSYNVDGYVFAQPLVAPNITIPGKGVHDVLYVVTENDSVYAFDADANVSTPYWTTSFLGTGVTTVPGGDANGNIYPVVGCTATPVIDPATGTMYVEAFTKETSGANVTYVHRLHALDITTGLERTNFNSPAVISCTNYPGTGTPGQNDVDGSGHILWNGLRETCRPALLLANGMVYLCYASPGDHPPYYGWIFSYDAHTLAQTGAFNDDPNAGYGGIWMTGNGPAADANGNVYLNTGNGVYDTSNDYGDSVLKLNGTNDLALEDYFTPYNQATLVAQDLDVSSAGLFLLPDSAGSAAHRHLLLSGSKTGSLYLIDRDTMGHYNSSVDADVQSLNGAVGGMWCSPAYFNGIFYVIGSGDHVKSFTMANATMGTTPTATSPNTFSASATPCLSANGTNNGILWAIDTTGAGSSGAAVLYAYNATNVSQELYSSSQNLTRDNPGAGVEFTTPVEANGKVYMGVQYAVSVFGNASFIATPVIAPNGGVFTNSISVTLSDTTPGVSIYYTLNGTTPTTSSTLYTDPFVLIHGTVVQAIAALPGYVNSGLSQASFINSSEIGTGTGLLGAYYGNHTSASPYTGSPTMTETDAVINFNWTSGPGGGIAETGFTVKWTGCVQPQYDETYTFYGTTDDGMRVWVNGQELINSWKDQASTTYQGSIALKSQQLYNIEVDYYQNGGGAVAELQWSSPSTPETVIPQSQLYPYTNPPPAVSITSPANNAIYTASASVTVGATADTYYNPVSEVDFYTNNVKYGSLTNSPDAPLYEMTMTGLAAGSYALTAVTVDGSGLMSTSAPINITVNAGSGQPYGLTNEPPTPAFFNMPTTFEGSLPPLLSQTGVFSNTPSMTPTAGLIPYTPNVILWSDGAAKTRYMAVPNNGGTLTSSQQIGFAPTNYWTFPAGTVFVKTFQLNTDTSNPNVLHRLETRLLVRDINGTVYGVTYKWRPDYSDADLLTNSLYENITITNSGGILSTQSWYYPSPSDCLKCHTLVANYVLGVNTRQLNGNQTYPSTGVTDNQLRTLNRLGLFNPAFNETNIATFEKLSALTNTSASFEYRVRSYLDANCAQCHQPRGTGPTFDARYDTPLTNQNLIYGALDPDGQAMIVPDDIWRSQIHQRMDTTNTAIRMPPLARQLIDTNAVAVLEDWINSLSGTPALAPVTITPNGGLFFNNVGVTLQSTNAGAAIYYTLDGTTPTTDSLLYSGPFNLTSNAVVSASAFETNYINSLSASALFLVPPAQFFSENISNGMFQMQFLGSPGSNYVLQVSTNLVDWTPMVTNLATTNDIIFIDPQSSNFPARFYRVQLMQP